MIVLESDLANRGALQLVEFYEAYEDEDGDDDSKNHNHRHVARVVHAGISVGFKRHVECALSESTVLNSVHLDNRLEEIGASQLDKLRHEVACRCR